MSNTNRDYLIVCEVKNSKITIARQLNFYITDKNTSNIFIRLVNRIENDNGISSYIDIENATAYNVTLRIVKPNNETMSIEATQLEPEALYQVDLGDDCKNIAGPYKCELLITTTVNGREELNTSDPFTYLVKNSILSKVGEIVESGGITTEKLLNDLNATKAELSSQIKDITNELENLSVSGLTTAQITALDNMFKICAYTSQDISTQYEAFKSAFGIGNTPTDKTLTSISVEYSGGDVAVGTALTNLTGITVTATYSDNSTATIIDYTLSGTIVEGANTITVTYQGQTASFTVTGVSQSTTNNILQPFTSYRLSSVLAPMYIITQSGNDYTFAINEAYTGNVTFQNGKAVSPTPLTNGTTYKLSVSEAITVPIYVYEVDGIPESGDTLPSAYKETFVRTWTKDTTEYTFTPAANYAGLRLAIASSTDITLKGLILEEV